MKIELLPVLKDNYIFIVSNPQTNNCFIVDPSVDEEVIAFCNNRKLNIKYIFNTHHHDDHIGGNAGIRAFSKCKIIAPIYDKHRINNIDIEAADSYKSEFEGFKFEVIYIPGHTLGHIAYFFPEQRILFCGDTLFSCGCGRLFEGTPDQMYNSLNKIISLPNDTQIYCAHEYTLNNAKFALSIEPNNSELIKFYEQVIIKRNNNIPTIPTTLATELKVNPFLRLQSEEIIRNIDIDSDDEITIFSKIRELKNKF